MFIFKDRWNLIENFFEWRAELTRILLALKTILANLKRFSEPFIFKSYHFLGKNHEGKSEVTAAFCTIANIYLT
jgi:hypothetical protein